MRPIAYPGALWEGAWLHPQVVELLQQRDCLLEFTTGAPPYAVTIGVPHHGWRGAERIAMDWTNPRSGEAGRAADEMTGINGLALLSAFQGGGLPARLVIAAHASDHDPNKTEDSPYWRCIFQAPLPRLLLELHGIAPNRRHSLELSAGRNLLAQPLEAGRRLAGLLPAGVKVAAQSRPGFDDARVFQNNQSQAARLQAPALNTPTLAQAGTLGVAALHLEMKPEFRDPVFGADGAVQPGALAWQLARALAALIGADYSD